MERINECLASLIEAVKDSPEYKEYQRIRELVQSMNFAGVILNCTNAAM